MSSKTKAVFFFGENCPYFIKRIASHQVSHTFATYAIRDDFSTLRDVLEDLKPDYFVNVLGKQIYRKYFLEMASKAAINIHPGPPEYGGFAPYSFAIYNDERQYGVTTHIMEPKVDTGKIISVKRFDMPFNPTVSVLREITMSHLLLELLCLIKNLGNAVINVGDFIPSDQWTNVGKWTREEVDKLMCLQTCMTEDELDRRFRATNYNQFKPYFAFEGKKFVYEGDLDG